MASRTRKKKVVKKSKAYTGELGDTIKHAKKRYGDSIVRMASEVITPDRISTGSFILDLCLLGGIPHNRNTMVVGERHAGKSMIAAKIMADAQCRYPDQTPILMDIEGTFDATWAAKLGVDIDSLPIAECDSGEQAVDVADAMVESKETSLLVIDSLAALTPMKEINSSAEDSHVALQSRLISGMVRKLNASLIRERKRGHAVTILYLNQFRMKIGVSFGDPRSIPGGKALEFCTSLQFIMKNQEKKGKSEGDVESMTSNVHPFTITKNKVCNGPRTGEFTLMRAYDEDTGLCEGDIDNVPTLVSYAKKFGVYSGGGTKWTLAFGDYSYTFKRASEAMSALYEDPQMQWALRNHLIALQAKAQNMPTEFLSRILAM